eukprot:767870-Hanusia_phi.AAC.5
MTFAKVIEEVNTIYTSFTGNSEDILSPHLGFENKGNVCFASALQGYTFTLESYARLYADTYGGFPAKEFAKVDGALPDRYIDDCLNRGCGETFGSMKKPVSFSELHLPLVRSELLYNSFLSHSTS